MDKLKNPKILIPVVIALIALAVFTINMFSGGDLGDHGHSHGEHGHEH
jgi:hypothetical protein